MTLHEIISQYGYIALFIGTFLEGETILLVAGYLAHEGHLGLTLAILSAFLGTFAGDQTFFFLGRARASSFWKSVKRGGSSRKKLSTCCTATRCR
ncbi:DedA family protein [Methylogaea oryzae]|uniref:DedA family protein n=1 Tax=Methylogaea oryzae TaxID=1295382 RepID=UPI001C3F3640|nr:hypothetical protein [Methylogaea oryzae]